jgi:hypothetical protein
MLDKDSYLGGKEATNSGTDKHKLPLPPLFDQPHTSWNNLAHRAECANDRRYTLVLGCRGCEALRGADLSLS